MNQNNLTLKKQVDVSECQVRRNSTGLAECRAVQDPVLRPAITGM